jgi:hypothetical protein
MVHDLGARKFKDKEMEELDIWGKPVSAALNEFKWALKTLRSGGKVRLSHWLPGCYIRVNGDTLVYSAGTGTESDHGFVLEWHQITATDWQAYGG